MDDVKSSRGQSFQVHSTLWWSSQATPCQNKGAKTERFVEEPNTLFAEISALRPRTAATCPSFELNPHHKHGMNKRSALTCRAFATKEEKGESCFQPVGPYPVKKSCGTNGVWYKSVWYKVVHVERYKLLRSNFKKVVSDGGV